MVQELLPLLPQDVGTLAAALAAGWALVGGVLWLTGARYSRGLITLVAVTGGGVLGMALPRWCGWPVNSAAAAVGGAVGLGLSGFVLHRAWVGLGLAAVLALWATLGTWALANGDAAWAWPALDASTTAPGYVASVWAALPEAVRTYLPYAWGTALTTGLAVAILWPRAAQVMLYSAAGATLLLGMGLAAITFGKPEWMRVVPSQTWAQLLTLFGAVAFGAVVQWQLAPATGSASKKKEADQE